MQRMMMMLLFWLATLVACTGSKTDWGWEDTAITSAWSVEEVHWTIIDSPSDTVALTQNQDCYGNHDAGYGNGEVSCFSHSSTGLVSARIDGSNMLFGYDDSRLGMYLNSFPADIGQEAHVCASLMGSGIPNSEGSMVGCMTSTELDALSGSYDFMDIVSITVSGEDAAGNEIPLNEAMLMWRGNLFVRTDRRGYPLHVFENVQSGSYALSDSTASWDLAESGSALFAIAVTGDGILASAIMDSTGASYLNLFNVLGDEWPTERRGTSDAVKTRVLAATDDQFVATPFTSSPSDSETVVLINQLTGAIESTIQGNQNIQFGKSLATTNYNGRTLLAVGAPDGLGREVFIFDLSANPTPTSEEDAVLVFSAQSLQGCGQDLSFETGADGQLYLGVACNDYSGLSYAGGALFHLTYNEE